jgi:putative oxidoreductase
VNLLDTIEPWAKPKRRKLFDYLRIILGLFIVYKGITFIQDIPELQEMSETVNVMLAAFLSTYVTTAHLIGGALLVFGLFTRWMSLIQIPILLGAVFLVNFPKGFLSMAGNIELGTSIIVLVGLVFFLVLGAGENSIDELRRRDKQRLEDLSAH